jgi:hypothetical protein
MPISDARAVLAFLNDYIEAFSAEAPPCFWIAAEHYLHGAICRPVPNHIAFALR